jgi:hypothetical protein
MYGVSGYLTLPYLVHGGAAHVLAHKLVGGVSTYVVCFVIVDALQHTLTYLCAYNLHFVTFTESFERLLPATQSLRQRRCRQRQNLYNTHLYKLNFDLHPRYVYIILCALPACVVAPSSTALQTGAASLYRSQFYKLNFDLHLILSICTSFCRVQNPVSAACLRRNLVVNGVADRATVVEGDNRVDLVAAATGNAEAVAKLEYYASLHAHRVNLGLLPSAEEAFFPSLLALRDDGGWLHVVSKAK